eukprot:3230383-Rhodomonas_salina.2
MNSTRSSRSLPPCADADAAASSSASEHASSPQYGISIAVGWSAPLRTCNAHAHHESALGTARDDGCQCAS